MIGAMIRDLRRVVCDLCNLPLQPLGDEPLLCTDRALVVRQPAPALAVASI